MGLPQTADTINLGIPVRGMNTRDPLAAMDPSYAPWILNFEPEPQSLKIRGGFLEHVKLTDESNILGLASHSGDLLAVGYGSGHNNRIYNVNVAGDQAAAAAVDNALASAVAIAPPVYFATRLAFLAGSAWADLSRVYTGSAWSAWGFTLAGTPIGGLSAASYRGRVYILTSTGTIYYSDIAGVTGAVQIVDYSSLFQSDEPLYFAGILTTSTNVPSETLLAIGNRAGEVIVFGGDNPGAPNWQVVARLKLPKVLYYNSVLQYRNDLLVATEGGLFSLRACMASASPDEPLTLSDPIDPYWTALCKSIAAVNPAIQGLSCTTLAYWTERNKIYIHMRGHTAQDGTFSARTGTMFIYNEISRGWTICKTLCNSAVLPSWITVHKDGLYFAIDNVVKKYSPTTFKDEAATGVYTAIPYALHSAYTNLGNANRNKRVVGIEPILKTDFTGSAVTAKAAADFGRKVSAASSISLLDGYQVAHYSVGAEGTFVGYRIEGNSDTASTDGLELYSVGLAIR